MTPEDAFWHASSNTPIEEGIPCPVVDGRSFDIGVNTALDAIERLESRSYKQGFIPEVTHLNFRELIAQMRKVGGR